MNTETRWHPTIGITFAVAISCACWAALAWAVAAWIVS